jgi:hypothetical protein
MSKLDRSALNTRDPFKQWGKYRVKQLSMPFDQNSNIDPLEKWQKYKISKAVEILPRTIEQEGNDWLPFVGKSALKGATDLADLPANLLHLAERGGRKTLGFLREQAGKSREPIDQGAENDYFSSNNVDRPSSWLKSGADKLGVDIEPRPSNPFQKIIGQGAEFATSSFVPGATFAKNVGVLDKFNKGINAAKIAAPVGVAAGSLEEIGVNPLVANIAAIPTVAVAGKLASGAAGISKSALKAVTNPQEAYYGAGRKIFGLTHDKVNLNALKAAKDLEVDLPASVFTSSPLTSYTDHAIQKFPFVGERLKKKYNMADEQIEKVLKNIYDKTGPKKTEEIESQIANLYTQRAKELPTGALIEPSNTIKALDSIKINSALPTRAEKDVLSAIKLLRNEMDPLIESNFGKVQIPIQPYSVDRLIDTKRSLNSMIKWDIDEGIKNQLRNINYNISKDIERYGQTNPDWYKTFKEADNLFASVAKREKLENLLGNASTNHASGNISYNSLSKNINSPKQKNLIKKQVDKDTFEKIKKLGELSKAIAAKNKNAPNPSGTASTLAFIGAASAIATNPLAGIKYAGLATGVAEPVARLFTDKKFLDSAIKIAENPTKPNILANVTLKDRMKKLTGISSPVILANELSQF